MHAVPEWVPPGFRPDAPLLETQVLVDPITWQMVKVWVAPNLDEVFGLDVYAKPKPPPNRAQRRGRTTP